MQLDMRECIICLSQRSNSSSIAQYIFKRHENMNIGWPRALCLPLGVDVSLRASFAVCQVQQIRLNLGQRVTTSKRSLVSRPEPYSLANMSLDTHTSSNVPSMVSCRNDFLTRM